MKPKTIKIKSENSLFQETAALKWNREKRNRTRTFIIEGVALLKQALAANWPVKSFWFSSQAGLSDWAKKILAHSNAKEHFDLSPKLMQELSDKDKTSELIAVARMPQRDLSAIAPQSQSLVVVLDRPHNPGNLGSAIRSCDAFKVDLLIISGHAADMYDPQALRASLGAFFALPAVQVPSHKEVLAWIAKARMQGLDYQILGSSAKGKESLEDCDLTKPTVLIIGNETYGLSQNYRQACQKIIRIPMAGHVSSLNMSCALSIMLYEAQRQRG